jgi:phage-related protein
MTSLLTKKSVVSTGADAPATPPDLQAFVAKHGGLYSAIPPDAWQEWDRQNEQWRAERHAYYTTLRTARGGTS